MMSKWSYQPKCITVVMVFMVFLSAQHILCNLSHARLIQWNGKIVDVAEPGEYIPTQIVVVEKPSSDSADVYGLAQDLGAEVLRENLKAGMYLLALSQDSDVPEALSKIDQEYGTSFRAFRNWKFSIPNPPQPELTRTPKGFLGSDSPVEWHDEKGYEFDGMTPKHLSNDPGLSVQWWLQKIKEPYCGNPRSTDKNIAIIDTGVDYTHSDLSGKVERGFDYVDWDLDPMDEYGHGTHCAGIAAATANNNIGIHGVSPNSNIWAYRALDRFGSGGFFQIASAIRDAADNAEVDILSLSLGGYLEKGSVEYRALRDAIDYARVTKQKIVCVAAGNDYNVLIFRNKYLESNYVAVPAYFRNSFTVGATQHQDYRSYFSNYDVKRTTSGDGTIMYNWNFVDIVAPGSGVLSTLPGEQYGAWDGTSMSTPIIAGACARVWGKYPAYTPGQVEMRLIQTGKRLRASRGFLRNEKRVDLMKALGRSKTGFQGRVIDGEKGYPVYDVKVQAMAGATVEATKYTDKAGYFTFSNLDSSKTYELRMRKEGYIERIACVSAPASGRINDLTRPYPLIPSRPTTCDDENWRIVVNWKSVEPGMDYWIEDFLFGGSGTYYPYKWYESPGMEANAYLQAPDGETYDWFNQGALGGPPYVRFMSDSWEAFVPLESHVIQRQKKGIYKYWLVCDAYDAGWGVTTFSINGTGYPAYPVVEIYKGNTLIRRIRCKRATQDGSGTLYWHVFNLGGDKIVPKNIITDTWPGNE